MEKYDESLCRIILCDSEEEGIRLHALMLIHGVEGGAYKNTVVCYVKDIDRIKNFYNVEHVAVVADVMQWTVDAARLWRAV